MSKVRADLFTNRTSDGAPDFPFGLQTVGIITAAGFSGSFEASGLTGTPNIDVANVNATGVVTASNGLDGIGIHSGGTAIHSGVITALNFVGTGNTFAVNGTTVDISISGGGSGGGSDSVVKSYINVLSSDLTLSAPNLTNVVDVDRDLTFDIEPGVEVTVDEGCFFIIRSA
tara:strand:+ start:97 stop:612 length:516 start_codon:yes stop_codon:yes gene_type:complete